MNNDDTQMDMPIETEEQAQVLEMMFREKAVAKVNANLISLEGINSPDDLGTDPHECLQCGEDIPVARVRALMTQVPQGDKTVWKANPNAVLCVDCATKNEKLGKQFWHGPKDESSNHH